MGIEWLRGFWDWLLWHLRPYDTISDEEYAEVLKGRAQIARGEYVTLDELRARPGSSVPLRLPPAPCAKPKHWFRRLRKRP